LVLVLNRLFTPPLVGVLDPTSYYLGLEVKQNDEGITISQGAYAKKIVEAAGLANCNTCLTPMESRLKLSKFSTHPAVDPIEYRRIVGALRYLVNTRPDIAFAMGYVSRFMEKPTTEHLVAVKCILRYVAGTVHLGCNYRRKKRIVALLGYSDNDHGADVDGRKSTSGVLYFCGDNAITWQSQKQKVVALSSCEAEYIAAATASCQGIWLARLLAELKGEKPSTITLKIDNQSAIQLSKNPVFHDRSKRMRQGGQGEHRASRHQASAGGHLNEGSWAGSILASTVQARPGRVQGLGGDLLANLSLDT
jgi:hypothetical protein